jgi:cobalt-precorrin 5A hydrolase/precorrin-3B C17-methyltransferase
VVLATIDRRLRHPAIVEAADGRPVVAFPPELLGLVEVPEPSQVVDDAVGTPSVAEAAALLAAGPGARLLVGKQRGSTTTTAVARGGRPLGPAGRLQVVGLGPGHPRHRTPAATAAVRAADAVLGYRPYVDAIEAILRPDQLVVRSGMGAEAERALAALALAGAGWRVALVSSGDPGVFAMASVTLELAGESGSEVAVDVVPGLTASSAAAAAVGAPLAGPHAVLTLSDLLLPWAVIEAQLRAAAGSGMALALYNPRSAGRPDHLDRARAVLLEVLDPSTPVACVTAATDVEEHVERSTLADLDPAVAGMRSLVLVGTPDTVESAGHLLTRRHHPRPAVAP